MQRQAIKTSAKQRSPRVEDPDLQKIFDQVFDEIGRIRDSVNREVKEDVREEGSGNSGDIRVVKDANEYRLNVKTEEGWVETKDGTFQLKA